MKFKVLFLFLFIILIFSCNHKVESKKQKANTILTESDSYFNNIDWTESESILPEPMPEPFSLKEINKQEIAFYSDINMQESIYPELEGLGTLDYSGIEMPLLNFLKRISQNIKEKKIEEEICLKEKVFLPYLINYRLKELEGIKSIYFSRPEYKENKKAVSKFRCNISTNSSENKTKYMLIEITVIFKEDKWLIDSFDVIGAKNASLIEPNWKRLYSSFI